MSLMQKLLSSADNNLKTLPVQAKKKLEEIKKEGIPDDLWESHGRGDEHEHNVLVDDFTISIENGRVVSLPFAQYYKSLKVEEYPLRTEDFEGERSLSFVGNLIPFAAPKKIVISVTEKEVLPLYIRYQKGEHSLPSFIEIEVASEGKLDIFEDLTELEDCTLRKITLEENAAMNHCMFFENSKHVGHTEVFVNSKAHYNHATIAFGDNIVRNTVDAVIEGSADSNIVSINLGRGDSNFEFNTTVDHVGNEGRSDQKIKNVLLDNAQAIFEGRIGISKLTTQNVAYQICNNILLSDHCKAYARPQLEIDAEDVRCSHGATTGQIDDDMLIYLESRGVKREKATSMLIQGHLKECVCEIKVAEFRQKINDKIASLLGVEEPRSAVRCAYGEYNYT